MVCIGIRLLLCMIPVNNIRIYKWASFLTAPYLRNWQIDSRAHCWINHFSKRIPLEYKYNWHLVGQSSPQTFAYIMYLQVEQREGQIDRQAEQCEKTTIASCVCFQHPRSPPPLDPHHPSHSIAPLTAVALKHVSSGYRCFSIVWRPICRRYSKEVICGHHLPLPPLFLYSTHSHLPILHSRNYQFSHSLITVSRWLLLQSSSAAAVEKETTPGKGLIVSAKI